MFPLLGVGDPPQEQAFRQSGAYTQLIEQEGTVVGSLPFKRSRQIAIISLLVGAILFAINGPEKFTALIFGLSALLVSVVLKTKYDKEHLKLLAIQKNIL